MDLLETLNVEDLPEQQTRTVHLLQSHPEFDLKLGFDSCCLCGKPSPKIECQNCHRVKYCSEECRQKDTIPIVRDDDDDTNGGDNEQALGHTSVICALLNLCNDDETIENGDSDRISLLDSKRQTAATDRLASEYESYPASLANIIMEGPCYQKTLEKCTENNIRIHVVGASEDSEFWKGHPDATQEEKVFECYADALAEMAENYKIQSILLQFFGPECPKQNINKTIPIPPVTAEKSKAVLHATTINTDYRVQSSEVTPASSSSPDVLVFFNPGFTCSDYDWDKSLSSMKKIQIPFLVATNTEMEAIADLQYLLDQKLVLDIPSGLEDMVGMNEGNDNNKKSDDDEEEDVESDISFFSVNPYCGMRVRQSGTMANDLYVKSRWIFGGITAGPVSTKRSSKNKVNMAKKRRIEGSGNTKKSNPALL